MFRARVLCSSAGLNTACMDGTATDVWVAQGGGRDLLGEPTVERMTATDWGWTCDRLIGSATACLFCHGPVAQMG